MIVPYKNTLPKDPFMGHGGRKLSRRHRPDNTRNEMNPKEFRYYESLDMIIPNIL